MTTRGHCHCGATRWQFEGAPTWACYCHCDDCRRNCGAPVVAWLGVPVAVFRWTGAAPATRESSPGAYRHFCASCGTPMAFEADHYPGDMHVYDAALEDPSAVQPAFHVHYDKRLPWLTIDDDLPKYDGSVVDLPEYAVIFPKD